MLKSKIILSKNAKEFELVLDKFLKDNAAGGAASIQYRINNNNHSALIIYEVWDDMEGDE